MTATVHHGDCLDVLRGMPDNSVDAICCDPPYGLSNTSPEKVTETIVRWAQGDREYVPQGKGFMGASWDAFVPPVAVWDECLRVLKPGGHLVAFAGSRTQDLMGLAIRLAGFDIRENLAWLYGSGFPKSMDISKAIDKADNARDEASLAVTVPMAEAMHAKGLTRRDLNLATGCGDNGSGSAQSWTTVTVDGARKPRIPTVSQWGTLRDILGLQHLDGEVWRLNGNKGKPGENWDKREVVGINKGAMSGWNMDGSTKYVDREITKAHTPEAEKWSGWGTALKPAHEPIILARKPFPGTVAQNTLTCGTGGLNIDATRIGTQPAGRWPANVVLDPDTAKALDQQSGTLKSGKLEAHHQRNTAGGNGVTHGAMTGIIGQSYADEGGASRFFKVVEPDPPFMYAAKAPKRERPSYTAEDGQTVQHATVKPLSIMQWLVRLVTPEGGTVLDPFAGSGTTVEAAILEGVNVIGIEREAEYLPLIQQRIDRASNVLPMAS